jgi:hypothetical protein
VARETKKLQALTQDPAVRPSSRSGKQEIALSEVAEVTALAGRLACHEWLLLLLRAMKLILNLIVWIQLASLTVVEH